MSFRFHWHYNGHLFPPWVSTYLHLPRGFETLKPSLPADGRCTAPKKGRQGALKGQMFLPLCHAPSRWSARPPGSLSVLALRFESILSYQCCRELKEQKSSTKGFWHGLPSSICDVTASWPVIRPLRFQGCVCVLETDWGSRDCGQRSTASAKATEWPL